MKLFKVWLDLERVPDKPTKTGKPRFKTIEVEKRIEVDFGRELEEILQGDGIERSISNIIKYLSFAATPKTNLQWEEWLNKNYGCIWPYLRNFLSNDGELVNHWKYRVED